MALSSREIDALEDIRIALLAKAQGPFGISTARAFANGLMQRACAAYSGGNVKEAIWLAEREFQFNCRVFGLDHAFTQSSMKALSALKRKQRNAARVSLVPIQFQVGAEVLSIA